MRKHLNNKQILLPWKQTLIVLIGTTALLTGGCGGKSSDEMKSYGHDGYMGISNSNPNMPNRHSNMSYQLDAALVEQALKPIHGIEPTRLSFNGKELNVILTVNNQLSEREIAKLRAQAQSIVQDNMPSYDVHIKIK